MSSGRAERGLRIGAGLVLLASATAFAAVPPDIMFYGRAGSGSIRYTQWNGTAWSASAPGSSVSAAPDWVRLAGCPTRSESMIVTIDASRVTRVFHHIGIYCYSATVLTQAAGAPGGRSMDVCYEQSSSDGFVAYWDGSASLIGARTSTNGTLSAEIRLFLPSSTAVTFLRLIPVAGTDQILLLALNNDKTLYACLWSGSAWGTVETLTADTGIASTECFAAAFERGSGDGLVVYGKAGTSDLTYKTFIGGVWSAEQAGPAVGNTVDWVRLAPKPAGFSNTILMGLLDHNKGVQVAFWNGSSWGALTSCTADAGTSSSRNFDVAYTPTASQAIVAYAKSGQNRPFSRVWTGAAWSSEAQGPDTGEPAGFLHLARGSTSSEVHVAWSDTGQDLHLALWNGSSIGGATVVDASLAGSATTEPFSINFPSSDDEAPRRITQWKELDPR